MGKLKIYIWNSCTLSIFFYMVVTAKPTGRRNEGRRKKGRKEQNEGEKRMKKEPRYGFDLGYPI